MTINTNLNHNPATGPLASCEDSVFYNAWIKNKADQFCMGDIIY